MRGGAAEPEDGTHTHTHTHTPLRVFFLSLFSVGKIALECACPFSRASSRPTPRVSLPPFDSAAHICVSFLSSQLEASFPDIYLDLGTIESSNALDSGLRPAFSKTRSIVRILEPRTPVSLPLSNTSRRLLNRERVVGRCDNLAARARPRARSPPPTAYKLAILEPVSKSHRETTRG